VEKDVNIGEDKMSGDALENILNRVFDAHKTDIESWRKNQEAKFEDNLVAIDPAKFVAILDISFISQDTWDGTNGYYDMKPQDYITTMNQFGEELPTNPHTTRQGLEKLYRFALKINEVPTEKMFQYRIVRASDAEGVGYFVGNIQPLQSLELRMRRAGVV
jgi:hypothetical protein